MNMWDKVFEQCRQEIEEQWKNFGGAGNDGALLAEQAAGSNKTCGDVEAVGSNKTCRDVEASTLQMNQAAGSDKVTGDSNTAGKDNAGECEKSAEKAFVVAIDGMCGSGKSTLGRRLQKYFQCSLFHMDDFFLQPHQRTPERLAQPGGNVDYERFQSEVLDHLQDKEGLKFRRFDCRTFSLASVSHIPYNRMVIIEGAYSCHPYFGDIYDVNFFLESSREGQLERILSRSDPEKLKRFMEVWIPMEEKYFDAFGIREKCLCVKVDE